MPRSGAFESVTPWVAEIEISLGALTYSFDLAPSKFADGHGPHGDDRVVVVCGRSAAPKVERDRSRLAGFLAGAPVWLRGAGDRGHLVAHSLGGGLDVNLFPQARDLNRGRSLAGRRWRRLERLAAARPGTPLFVRPIYASASWTPARIEYALLVEERLLVEQFLNRD